MQKLKLNEKEDYKETELGLLPKEWRVVTLNDVCEKMKAGGTPSTTVKAYWENGNIPIVKVEDAANAGKILNSTNLSITKEGLENSSAWVVPVNSILLTMYGTAGEVCINSVPVAVTQNVMGIIKKDGTDTEYLYYALKFAKEYTLHLITDKTIFTHFSLAKSKKLIFPSPPLPEQRNIAFVLSTVQDAQQSTERAINSLRELKKSLMKHLFTYGAVSFEDAANVKLKETEIGRVPEGWKVSTIGDAVKLQGRVVVNSDNFVSFEHIESGTGKILFMADAKKYRTKTPFAKGTLLYGRIRPYLNKIWIADVDGYCTNDIIRMVPFNSDLLFIKYRLLSQDFVKYATEKSTGTKMPRVKWDSMEKFPLALPTLPEQQQIASILGTVDEKIGAEQQREKALTKLFNSLLKNLMTAKIRVKDLKV